MGVNRRGVTSEYADQSVKIEDLENTAVEGIARSDTGSWKSTQVWNNTTATGATTLTTSSVTSGQRVWIAKVKADWTQTTAQACNATFSLNGSALVSATATSGTISTTTSISDPTVATNTWSVNITATAGTPSLTVNSISATRQQVGR